jgi:hypothetical protein
MYFGVYGLSPISSAQLASSGGFARQYAGLAVRSGHFPTSFELLPI